MNTTVKLGLIAGDIGLLMVGIAFIGTFLGWDGAPELGIVGLVIFAMVWFNIIQPYKYSDYGGFEEDG